MPDSENPEPPKPAEEEKPLQPTEIDDTEYNQRSDEYMDAVNEKAEAEENDDM